MASYIYMNSSQAALHRIFITQIRKFTENSLGFLFDFGAYLRCYVLLGTFIDKAAYKIRQYWHLAKVSQFALIFYTLQNIIQRYNT